MSDTVRRRKRKIKGTVAVSHDHYKDGEKVGEGKTITHPVREITGEPSKVGAGGGITKSPVQFESVRIDVYVEIPCSTCEEDIDNSISWCLDKVNEAIGARCEELGIDPD